MLDRRIPQGINQFKYHRSKKIAGGEGAACPLKMQMLTCLTTLPHLLVVFLSPSPVYSCIVVSSTAASFIWHWRKEPRGWLFFTDYALAYIWFVADAYYSIQANTFIYVTAMNAAIVTLNYIALWLAKEKMLPYSYGHSIWHILSVIKVIEVALLLTPVPMTMYDTHLLRGTSDLGHPYDYRSLYPLG